MQAKHVKLTTQYPLKDIHIEKSNELSNTIKTRFYSTVLFIGECCETFDRPESMENSGGSRSVGTWHYLLKYT